MESILRTFLTAVQNSTSDRGASDATSTENGEAAESTVSMFPLQIWWFYFMDVPDIIRFSCYQLTDLSLISDDCWETHGHL